MRQTKSDSHFLFCFFVLLFLVCCCQPGQAIPSLAPTANASERLQKFQLVCPNYRPHAGAPVPLASIRSWTALLKPEEKKQKRKRKEQTEEEEEEEEAPQKLFQSRSQGRAGGSRVAVSMKPEVKINPKPSRRRKRSPSPSAEPKSPSAFAPPPPASPLYQMKILKLKRNE